MRLILAATALGVSLAAGCGDSKPMGRVKGELTNDGKPFPLPPSAGEVFLVFRFIGEDGKPDQMRMYSAKVYENGHFEVVSSGGELPVGIYQVAIDAVGSRVELFKAFALPDSAARIEFKSGSNDVKIDLAKPNG